MCPTCARKAPCRSIAVSDFLITNKIFLIGTKVLFFFLLQAPDIATSNILISTTVFLLLLPHFTINERGSKKCSLSFHLELQGA